MKATLNYFKNEKREVTIRFNKKIWENIKKLQQELIEVNESEKTINYIVNRLIERALLFYEWKELHEYLS